MIKAKLNAVSNMNHDPKRGHFTILDVPPWGAAIV